MLRRAILTGVFAFGLAMPAMASGGAHVIDDSEVETAGSCHLEAWRTAGSARSRFVDLSPACTFRRLPNVEFGGFVNRARVHGETLTLAGLAPKLTLQPESSGLGVGLSGNIGVALRSGRVSTAAMIVPVTVPVTAAVRVNLNGGWLWTRGLGHEAFAGMQIEIAVAKRVTLMAESFGRCRTVDGAQAGLRWTIDKGRIDIDLLASRYGDGQARNAVTLGMTIRR